MDLKSVLKGKESLEFYWALVIEPGWVQAGIWSIQQGSVNVVSIGPPAAWEGDEELTNACDSVLSAAIQNLPEDAEEPSKTVFGVTSSWVSEGQIKQEFLDKIKKICSSLSLTPVGFVVLSEAVSHLIKSEEGTPLNAIVIGFGSENIEISVFKLGNYIGTQVVSRSVSIVDDLKEGLSRFSITDALPSRILIYDGKEGQLDDVRQSLMGASWEDNEKIKFLHTPKIEIVSPERKVLATALAGGAEIADVNKVENIFKQPTSIKTAVTKEPLTKTSDTEIGKDLENVEKPQNLSELGFVMDKDIGKEEGQKPQGLPIEEKPEFKSQDTRQEIPRQEVEYKTPEPAAKNKFSNLLKNVTTKINTFLEKFGASKGYSISEGGYRFFGKKALFLTISIFLFLFVGGGLFWWYYPKASITIYISPQKLEESDSIFIDPSLDSIDFAKKILPAETITEKIDGEKTKSTTGTKVVGEKAKGEITLYRSGSEITLNAGTALGGPGGLSFTLDESVTIASGSASTPGTSKAQITAKDIGAQYNLAAGESFGVSNYPKSEIEAKNENALSGGSSREISAVSQDDWDELREDLENELKEKLVEKIKESIADDEYFIKESVSIKILEEDFSDKIGDEASTLKLSLSCELKGLQVKTTNLVDLAKEALKGKVAEGYVLREDQISYDFEYIDQEKGIYELKANYKANLLPEVNIDKIKKDIAGKHPDLANEYLSSIKGFSKVKITQKPKLPGRLGTLPRVEKNISIELSAD